MHAHRIGPRVPRSVFALAAGAAAVTCFSSFPARAQSAGADDAGDDGAPHTVEVGQTGFGVKRPVLATACEHGCPWGELGDFLTAAMQPLGYDIIQCRNCNEDKGPPLVSQHAYPPMLGIADTFVGTTTRVDAPVDFGITEIGFLAWAYHGLYDYAPGGAGAVGPFTNLRLLAKIEDPTYLLVAVKASSGITDLAQIAQKKMGVTIVGGDTPISKRVLDYYGLSASAVGSWGGSIDNAIIFGQIPGQTFDVVVSELASPANNPESSFWTMLSQTNDLAFLDLAEPLLTQLAGDSTLGLTRVTAKWGFLRGVNRPIATVARSGHAVFGRDDMPDQAAYDVAKAVDESRANLKWFIRPYSYDPRTAWQDLDVPLHPGAARYYSEMGYMGGSGDASACAADASAASAKPSSKSGGCGVGSPAGASSAGGSLALLALAVVLGRRRGGRR